MNIRNLEWLFWLLKQRTEKTQTTKQRFVVTNQGFFFLNVQETFLRCPHGHVQDVDSLHELSMRIQTHHLHKYSYLLNLESMNLSSRYLQLLRGKYIRKSIQVVVLEVAWLHSHPLEVFIYLHLTAWCVDVMSPTTTGGTMVRVVTAKLR